MMRVKDYRKKTACIGRPPWEHPRPEGDNSEFIRPERRAIATQGPDRRICIAQTDLGRRRLRGKAHGACNGDSASPPGETQHREALR